MLTVALALLATGQEVPKTYIIVPPQPKPSPQVAVARAKSKSAVQSVSPAAWRCGVISAIPVVQVGDTYILTAAEEQLTEKARRCLVDWHHGSGSEVELFPAVSLKN